LIKHQPTNQYSPPSTGSCMERIVHKAKNHREAEKWDISQHITQSEQDNSTNELL